LDYLDKTAGHIIPIHRATIGNIAADILRSKGRKSLAAQAPLFVKSAEKLPNMPPDTGGMLWRRCTQHYKLKVLRRETRRLYLAAGRPKVRQLIGISIDEWTRQKPSRVKYIQNIYPLIDLNMTRRDCVKWLLSHGHPEPGKSACWFCPYHSNAAWAEMRKHDPGSWEKACTFDDALRADGTRLPGVTGEAYVHRSFTPLRSVPLTIEDRGQVSLFGDDGFGNECEGMCGL
jgi:hypothetical protein